MGIPLFLVVFKNYFRRLLRDILGLIIFTVIPLVLVIILSIVSSQNQSQEIFVNGYNMRVSHLAVFMMLMFQINGGLYLLNCLNVDFESPLKWRLQAVPCHKHTFTFACIVACAIFNIIQGLLIVVFTGIFMKAYWGNLLVTFLAIILISLLSQLMSIILFLYIKNINTAEILCWFISWTMAAFGGVMFKLPDNEFFIFMEKYGTPLTLARSAIISSGFIHPSDATVWICLGALFAITAIFALMIILLGRRKLA